MFPIVLQADVAATLAVEDRTEVRARYIRAVGSSQNLNEGVADVETDPLLRFQAKTARTAFTMQYAPRLIFTNLFGDGKGFEILGKGVVPGDTRKFDHVQQLTLSGEYQFDSRTRIAVLANGSYGQASTASLLVQPRWLNDGAPPAPRPLPIVPKLRLEVVSAYGYVGAAHFLSRNWLFLPSANLVVYGGPTLAAREFLPFLVNPWIDLAFKGTPTKKDEVEFGLQPQFSKSQTSAGTAGGNLTSVVFPTIYQVNTTARYRHRFDKYSRVEIAGGGSVLGQSLSAEDASGTDRKKGLNVSLLPFGEALAGTGWAFSETRKGELVFVTRVAPWLNTFVGEAYARSESILGLRVSEGRNAIRATGAVLVALAPKEKLKDEFNLPAYRRSFFQVFGEFAFERKLNRELTADIGARLSLQEAATTNPFSPSRILQPGAFIGLAWVPTPAKL
jgi:hypothetical protein